MPPRTIRLTSSLSLGPCSATYRSPRPADVDQPARSGAPVALHYLATADQVGPVVYRDPLGAISPDGGWLAYTERDRVHVTPASGGCVRVLGPGTNSIRYLAWLPDSRRIAVRERVFDRSRQDWFLYDVATGERSPLWPGEPSGEVHPRAMDQLAWSPDGAEVAGVVRGSTGTEIWTAGADGSSSRAVASGALSFPSWTPDGRLACLSTDEGSQTLQLPCGDPTASAKYAGMQAYGRVAFSPDATDAYIGSPGEGGFLDLWAVSVADGSPRRLTRFARDSYDPSVAPNGSVFFKTQDYRVFLATAPAGGGPTTPLTTFQSETPSWSWDGANVAFTFGDWRHVTDDIHYPDIAQHIGVVDATKEGPWDAPTRVVRSTFSEDQGMNWSPNGRWIAFHTHESGDDIWLMRADGSGEARMISEDGSETGWPRWSPDGRSIAFKSFQRDSAGARHAYLYVIGVDQETGETTPQRRVDMGDFAYDVGLAEWGNDGDLLVVEAAEAIGRKSIWSVDSDGGTPRRIHSFGSDQVTSGIGVSHDRRWVAYVDLAPDGYYQIFRVPVAGGAPEQLTHDPSNKTQPAYSPIGDRIAFTVFSYRAHLWRIDP